MKRFFLGGLVVAPLLFVACATGGASGDDPGGGEIEGEGGDGGTAGAGGKAGKGGGAGKGGTSSKGGSGGSTAGGGQGGTLGGSGSAGAPLAGAGGSAGKAGGNGGSAGKGGSGAGTGGASGKGGSSGGGGSAGSGGSVGGTAGSAGGAGKGGSAAGSGGTSAGNGGSTAGSAGTSAGSGGSSAGAGGGTAGNAGSSAGTAGAAGSVAGGAGGSAGAAGSAGAGGSAGSGGSGPVDACATAIAAMMIDFEQTPPNPIMSVGGLDGFGAGSSWPYVQFVYGTPSAAKAAKGGPTKCAGGSATCLANSINDDYCQCGRSFAITPTWNLSACTGRNLRLSFDHWYEFSVIPWQGTTYYDGGAVELSGTAASPWTQGVAAYTGTININGNMGSSYACNSQNSFYVDGRPGFIGTSAGAWVHEEVAIPANLITAKFAARFIWSSGVSYQTTNETTSRLHSSAGWYIDNIGIVLAP